jgi:hypothetical protein
MAAQADAAKARSKKSSPAASVSTPESRPRSGQTGKDLGTLDEITIEGEIAAPQVLFITARDRARYFDPNHRLYLKSCTALGREAPLPLPRCIAASR